MLQRRHANSSSRGLLIGLLVLICTIAVASSIASVHAQSAQLAVSIDGFSSQEWPQAQSILTVLDANGKPVEGLTLQDIHAQVDGADVAVTSVSRGVDSNLPSFVVLALDASAGMAGAPLDQTKAAAHQFLDALGPQDSVAILAYSDAPNLVQPFTQDRLAAHAAIDSLTAGGGNGLYKVATQGVLLGAASAQTGRRALVLLSSGADDTQDDPRQSLVAAKGLGVPIFIIGLGSGIDRAYLQQLTDAGGGRFSETSTPDGLVSLYHDVSELLRNQYVVSLDASALRIETSRAVTLHVDVTAGESTGTSERVVCPAQVCASFRELQAGARLAKSQSLVADVVASESIQSVSLLIDGSPVQTLQDAPYQFTIDPVKFKSGAHTLGLAVTTSSGNVKLGEMSVQLGATSGSGFGMLPLVFVLFVVIIALLAIFFFLRKRRRGSDAPKPAPPSPEPGEPVSITIAKNRARLAPHDDAPPPPPPAEMEPVLGYLKMTGGPLAGQTFVIGAKPVSIGSGHRCQIQLPSELDGYEVPSEFARVWVRAEQLMVHEIRRLTAFGAEGGQWEILSNHDTFAIGPCVFRFDLDELVVVPPEPIPNVLREKPAPTPPPAEPAFESAPAFSEPAQVAAAEASASEPVPNIFRDRAEDVPEEAEDPPMEQAAGG
jgi:VWFA-related protein